MLSDDELNEYVASVLKDRAAKQAAAYSQLGFRAFLKNADKDRPTVKPNTRFLANIVRGVEGHNKALARKEEQEARDKLRELSRRDEGEKLSGWKEDYSRRDDGRRGRERSRSASPRRKERGYDDGDRDYKRRRRRDHSSDEEREERRYSSRRKSRHVELDSERRRSRRKRDESDESDNERRYRRKERREEPGERREGHHRRRDDSDDNSRERRSEHRSSSNRENRDSPRYKSGRHRKRSHRRHQSSSPSPPRPRSHSPPRKPTRNSGRSPQSIGPDPPTHGPEFVRAKGRGRMNGGTLDAKFAKDYDPRTDVHHSDDSEPEEEYELDDWGIALRALRDQKAHALSSAMTDRLAETQAQSAGTAWPTYSQGEREWDKGKVVLDDGSVGVKVWGVDRPA